MHKKPAYRFTNRSHYHHVSENQKPPRLLWNMVYLRHEADKSAFQTTSQEMFYLKTKPVGLQFTSGFSSWVSDTRRSPKEQQLCFGLCTLLSSPSCRKSVFSQQSHHHPGALVFTAGIWVSGNRKCFELRTGSSAPLLPVSHTRSRSFNVSLHNTVTPLFQTTAQVTAARWLPLLTGEDSPRRLKQTMQLQT